MKSILNVSIRTKNLPGDKGGLLFFLAASERRKNEMIQDENRQEKTKSKRRTINDEQVMLFLPVTLSTK